MTRWPALFVLAVIAAFILPILVGGGSMAAVHAGPVEVLEAAGAVAEPDPQDAEGEAAVLARPDPGPATIPGRGGIVLRRCPAEAATERPLPPPRPMAA